MLEERHEIVKFSPNIPIKIFMHKIGFVSRHWHQSIELLMILDGNVNIRINEQSYDLSCEDIILINSNDIHELRSEGAVMIALQIDLARFDNLGDDLENMVFQCNSAARPDDPSFNSLRYAIATMIRENAHNARGTEYKNYAISYYLISELIAHSNRQIRLTRKTRKSIWPG